MRENPQIHALEKVCCVKIRLNALCYCSWVNLAVINCYDTFYDVLFEILASFILTSSILINITVMLLKIKGFAKQMAFFFHAY